jgi:hypothetical protein
MRHPFDQHAGVRIRNAKNARDIGWREAAVHYRRTRFPVATPMQYARMISSMNLGERFASFAMFSIEDPAIKNRLMICTALSFIGPGS